MRELLGHEQRKVGRPKNIAVERPQPSGFQARTDGSVALPGPGFQVIKGCRKGQYRSETGRATAQLDGRQRSGLVEFDQAKPVGPGMRACTKSRFGKEPDISATRMAGKEAADG